MYGVIVESLLDKKGMILDPRQKWNINTWENTYMVLSTL
jgi:hypothetical protein